MIRRPPTVAMRARKPWRRLRTILEGWKVRFTGLLRCHRRAARALSALNGGPDPVAVDFGTRRDAPKARGETPTGSKFVAHIRLAIRRSQSRDDPESTDPGGRSARAGPRSRGVLLDRRHRRSNGGSHRPRGGRHGATMGERAAGRAAADGTQDPMANSVTGEAAHDGALDAAAGFSGRGSGQESAGAQGRNDQSTHVQCPRSDRPYRAARQDGARLPDRPDLHWAQVSDVVTHGKISMNGR